MTITLYELAGADAERRFSPFVWRSRMALLHKGLAYEGRPWRFTEKEAIAFSGQGKVPVLVDGDATVADSWEIACYLETVYPDRPSLFGGEAGREGARFVQSWFDMTAIRFVAQIVMADVHAVLHEDDKDYFRTTREERFGKTLEEVSGDPAGARAGLTQALAPMRAILKTQPYLAGDAPNYMDYIPFGAFMWARCVSPLKLLEADDPVEAWRQRLLDAHDGAARRATCSEAD
ncbi:MAG: glutathione S-transferase family protein [Alphaproteobacteria bacterium]|nr:glutathione S-transferase family protein [Alphaproteobacteria bacterium]